MSHQRFRIAECLPASFPDDDETAQVLVLAVLASIYPKGIPIPSLVSELGDEREEWVERAVRDLGVANLVRCHAGTAYATFRFSGARSSVARTRTL